jgi:hypothetical protein
LEKDMTAEPIDERMRRARITMHVFSNGAAVLEILGVEDKSIIQQMMGDLSAAVDKARSEEKAPVVYVAGARVRIMEHQNPFTEIVEEREP